MDVSELSWNKTANLSHVDDECNLFHVDTLPTRVWTSYDLNLMLLVAVIVRKESHDILFLDGMSPFLDHNPTFFVERGTNPVHGLGCVRQSNAAS